MSATEPLKLIRLPEVVKRTGMGRSSVYRQIADRTFPAPASLGGRTVAWVEAEVSQWIADRIAARDAARSV